MGTTLTPEERHLAAQEAILAGLAEQLAEREAELAAVEAAYLRFVGVAGRLLSDLLAERAQIDYEIARILARLTPADLDLRSWEGLKAREATDMAGISRALAVDGSGREHNAETEAERREKDPELRRLFREAAKRFHPDLASNEHDRARRTRLMAELNRLCAAGDIDGMRRLIESADLAPEAVEGDGTGARIVRVLRQIAQVELRLGQIEAAFATLRERPLWDYYEQAQADPAFLDQLAARLRAEIREKQVQREALLASA